MKLSIIIFYFTLLNKILVISQDTNIFYYDHFCQQLSNFSNVCKFSGSKFTDYHSGIKKAYLFNGDFSYPFNINSNNFIFKNIFFNIQFSPDIRIRIFQNDITYNDKSKPIRTPSYNPKISFSFSNLKLWRNNYSTFYFLQLNFLHHSNGQDGWEFDYPEGTINLYNGSFSETLYFQFLLGKITKFSNNNNLFYKTGFEWHPKKLSNIKLQESKLYGGNRILTNFQFSFAKKYKNRTFERQRLCLDIEYITDLTYYKGGYYNKKEILIFDISKRMNLLLTYYYTLLKTNTLAFFSQLAYLGSDSYNIYFQQSYYSVRIGLSFGKFY